MVCDTSFRIGTLEGTLSLVYRTLELVSQFLHVVMRITDMTIIVSAVTVP